MQPEAPDADAVERARAWLAELLERGREEAAEADGAGLPHEAAVCQHG